MSIAAGPAAFDLLRHILVAEECVDRLAQQTFGPQNENDCSVLAAYMCVINLSFAYRTGIFQVATGKLKRLESLIQSPAYYTSMQWSSLLRWGWGWLQSRSVMMSFLAFFKGIDYRNQGEVSIASKYFKEGLKMIAQSSHVVGGVSGPTGSLGSVAAELMFDLQVECGFSYLIQADYVGCQEVILSLREIITADADRVCGRFHPMAHSINHLGRSLLPAPDAVTDEYNSFDSIFLPSYTSFQISQ